MAHVRSPVHLPNGIGGRCKSSGITNSTSAPTSQPSYRVQVQAAHRHSFLECSTIQRESDKSRVNPMSSVPFFFSFGMEVCLLMPSASTLGELIPERRTTSWLRRSESVMRHVIEFYIPERCKTKPKGRLRGNVERLSRSRLTGKKSA